MTKLGGEFDATRIEPEQPFEVLPVGKYLVQAVDSDVRSTKDGSGTYLWFEFEVLDMPYSGRRIWDRINQQNASEESVRIGNRRFSALCHATGKLRVSDTAELHGIPVVATVQVRPAQEATKENGWKAYSASNAIRGYAPAAGAPGAPRPADKPTALNVTQQAQQVPATAPWKRAQGS